jgi:TrmH family RNA methyltransferase
VITSARNPAVAAALGLRARPRRERARRFLVEGPGPVGEALRAGVVETLFTGADNRPSPPRIPRSVVPHEVSAAVMRRLAGTVTPQGPVAVCRFVDVPLDAVRPSRGPVVLLVEARDPGNVGTILRTAHAAGCAGVLVSARSVDVYNEKAARASAGSLFHVPVVRDVEPAAAVASLRGRGVTVVAVAADGEEDLYGERAASLLASPVAFVFGNEARGLDAGLRAAADVAVRIPMPGGAESLNLASAAAVVLFEAARRRAAVALGRRT